MGVPLSEIFKEEASRQAIGFAGKSGKAASIQTPPRGLIRDSLDDYWN